MKFSLSILKSPGKFPREEINGSFEPKTIMAPMIRKNAPIQRNVLPSGSKLGPLETRTGGEGGIRTPGRCYPTLAFQASTINRSDTSPVLGCDYDVFPRSGPVKEIRSKSSMMAFRPSSLK